MNYLDRIDKLIDVIKDKKYHTDFFNSNLEGYRILNFYKLGYWDHILLGYDKSLNVYIAIRIVANLKPEQWPVVYIERGINSVMMCSSLKALPMLKLEGLINSKSLFESFHEEIEEIKEVCKPIYTLLNLENTYFSYINYLSDKNNIPKERKDFDSLKEKKEAVLKEYLKVYQYFDDSDGFKVFIDVINDMNIDENIVPKIENKDYGVWTTRIFKTLGMRSYFDRSNVDLSDRLLNFWRSFLEPHAYDPQTPTPGHYPKNSTDTHNFYNNILGKLLYHKNDFHEEIKKHPLFEVVLNMNNSEYSNSLGFAKAAAIIDEQYDDSVLVWKTLINASYYTSSVKQHQLLAKQAKELCQRNGWDTAAEAVARNIVFYNEMQE